MDESSLSDNSGITTVDHDSYTPSSKLAMRARLRLLSPTCFAATLPFTSPAVFQTPHLESTTEHLEGNEVAGDWAKEEAESTADAVER